MDVEDQLNPEDKAQGEDIANEPADPELPAPRFGYFR
jgi:hypothetical protein